MRKKNYINNKELFKEICIWIDNGKTLPVTQYISDSLQEMIRRISTRRNFRNYVFLEDMKSEATIHCLKALSKTYDKTKDNPYGYFTTCIHNAFVQIIKKENKFVDFKFHLVQDSIDTSMKLDRNKIVGFNRNSKGDVIDENDQVLTTVKTLKENKLY